MLKNQNIICISSIDWDFIWQQHQAIMSRLAVNHNRVLFIENTGVRAVNLSDMSRLHKRLSNWSKSVKGFRQIGDNLYIYSPLIIPLPYFRIARLINKNLLLNSIKRWMKIMNFHDPIIWTFLPTPLVLDLQEEIPHKAMVYYCTDNFSATSKSAKKVVHYEEMVVQKSDAVFVMAKDMADYFFTLNKNTICVPMGVDVDKFSIDKQANEKPFELRKTKNRIIGYLGGIRKSLDQELIIYLSEKFKQDTFVFLGPIQTDVSQLKILENLIFIDQKPHADLPSYLKYFDLCIMPYKKDDYTDNISPGKLNEYLIMGKPVVSTKLKQVVNFNAENSGILYIAEGKEDFAWLIDKAFREDSDELRNKRKKVAYSNSWDSKVELMSGVIEEVINRDEETVLNWQDKLLRVYRIAHRKTAGFLFLLVILWLLVFYTPLVWWSAGPLKISQVARNADCIVVFAGGVGESGKAGQGYEERVKYAVKLYKDGFARNMIFSSGYMYVFKEPLVMKILAVSLGVSEEVIILEDSAKNTYENVKFTKEILDRHNWKNILLVSSPYHMRRVSLVFKKVAKDINVTYTSIPNSLFYSRHYLENQQRSRGSSLRQINPAQVSAIFHEYLGIVYYWLKGRI